MQYFITKHTCFIFLLLFFVSTPGLAQEAETTLGKILSFPVKAQTAIDKKIKKLDAAFEKEISKQLSKLQKQEDKIYKKLKRRDTAEANSYRLQSQRDIATLKNKLANPGKALVYSPSLDTLTSTFSFLSDSSLSGIGVVKLAAAKQSLLKIESLQGQLQKSEELKTFFKQRKEYLAGQLSKFGLVKELKNINKQAYYYTQQINEYKEILNDPKKIEKKAIELLSKTKLFQDFMAKNSLLAGLFPSAAGGATADPTAFLAANPTLQTRAMLNNIIQQQIAAGGPNAQASFQQNLQDAQSQITQLKDKVLKAGAGNSDDVLPQGFKPYNQKAKTFLKRLEYGTNIQTQKATSYFPVTSDIALSVGYKLNDKSVIGIGASFKLGFGRGWDNIKLTSQGIGLRSFIDWKLKGNFYISGGYEQNYRNAITSFGQLQNVSAWQQSGLIGISKSVPVKTKFFKKTSVKLLWDFLSYRQVPKVQPLIFRVGYNF